jgi:hypothetical protein
MIAVRNLTSHDLVVYSGTTPILVVPPNGNPARLVEQVSPGTSLGVGDLTIPTALVSYSDEVVGLPDPVLDTVLVVSRVLAAEVRRPDVFFPLDEVTNGEGRILGCRALAQFVERIPDQRPIGENRAATPDRSLDIEVLPPCPPAGLGGRAGRADA